VAPPPAKKEYHKYKGDWISAVKKCRGLCNIREKEEKKTKEKEEK